MSDLVAFLNARLDEDEAAAKLNGGWWTVTQKSLGTYVGCQDAERTRREVEAKRAILADILPLIESEWGCADGILSPHGERLARYLALPYSDHPDYDKDWA